MQHDDTVSQVLDRRSLLRLVGLAGVAAATGCGDAVGTANTASTTTPTITALSATSGSTAGGGTVTITGTNLSGVSQVLFGEAAASGTSGNSGTQVTVTVPAHISGTVSVVLTAAAGTVTKAAAYTYTTTSTVDLVILPVATSGPFPEELSDYVNSSDLLNAARASSGVISADRAAVLNGVPMTLTLNLSTVLGTNEAALEAAAALAGATVYIWHCDTLGRYSAVSDSDMQAENTSGQKWLRAYQVSSSAGQVVFSTIVPGWYTPRIMHFHLRVHLPSVASATTYALTTQLFFPTAVTDAISITTPYTSNTQSLTTPNSADQVWQEVLDAGGDPTLMQMAVSGSLADGYAASVHIGILSTVAGWRNPYQSPLCMLASRVPHG